MSEPVRALNGAGYAEGIARVCEAPLQGMITLRGDLDDPAVQAAALAVAPGAFPGPGQAHMTDNRGIAWMSPDEALVLCSYSEVLNALGKMHGALGQTHALAVNVSDARACFYLEGAQAREVLGKLCPVDLAPRAFTPGMFRRTRMAQVPAAFWLRGDETFQIICFRSQAQYVFDLLCVAAQPGSDVWV